MAWTGLLSGVASPAAPPAEPVITAYVFPQETLLTPGQVAGRKVTRINYAFANIADGGIVEGFPQESQNLATLVSLKKENPKLLVLASVGGWSWSGGFSDAALTETSRAVFVNSAVGYLERHSLDGIDIDWEYPGMPGAGHKHRAQDKQNFTLLLRDMRARFDREEKALHRHLYLTIAGGSSDEYLDHTEMREVAGYVDTVNLMAYDYYEPSDDKRTGNHAPLFTDPADPKKTSADNSVRLYEQAGVPAAKLVLGVPFYGHAWSNVPPANGGLFQPGGGHAPDATYSDIAANLLGHGYVRGWDAAASAPYLYHSQNRTFVSYEDPASLTLKCRYVREHHLAGMMFWEYSNDPGGVLLDAIDKGLDVDASMQKVAP
jgi:chitinase